MFGETIVTVNREVSATLIPTGVKVMLQAGTQVSVTQSLGDSYTVFVSGNLVQIAGKDGDALGLVVIEQPDINEFAGTVEDKVWRQMKSCYDPEIPVNIVDLGLVYSCVINHEQEGYNVAINMTLTAVGCGMGPVLIMQVKEKIQQIKEVIHVEVTLVFDPPWDREKMSDEAKLQLGLF